MNAKRKLPQKWPKGPTFGSQVEWKLVFLAALRPGRYGEKKIGRQTEKQYLDISSVYKNIICVYIYIYTVHVWFNRIANIT